MVFYTDKCKTFCTKRKRCKQKRQNITLYNSDGWNDFDSNALPAYLRAHTYTLTHTYTFTGAYSNAIVAKFAQMPTFSIFR